MRSSFELSQKIAVELRGFSSSPFLDAHLLVSQTLHRIREDQAFSGELQTLVERRKAGEPLAYLLGKKDFWDITLQMTPEVLIPRPETELLVEWVLNHYPADALIRVADLGTGSGAIALALAHARPNWCVEGTDFSACALDVAKKNAQFNQLNTVNFCWGDWCAALFGRYDVIVSNPPYLSEAEFQAIRVTQEVNCRGLFFEPQMALIAGFSGFEALDKIIVGARAFLNQFGWLVLEHGALQKNAVVSALQGAKYLNVQTVSDLAGLPRMTVAQWVGEMSDAT